ncbi:MULTISPECIES: ATP-binding cassette domain-containing protein [unclassified Rhizobium]|uniref:ATP-binding cassette domain-containing protein n=1 Tax=unclassified Rhizobium TaxID=2613769 RepID=UPI001A9A07CC|nr:MULTISPECIES: ATP-binding cassette domain-containing protein [unclassified Rhizobium]QSZ60558.1 ATP-binding cassette domain-containing protein [Rhizobium sp. ZX09]
MAILRVENLEKRYGERIVGPVSFTLTAGEVGLVVGGSGSGKSTLLDLIYGTRTATAGTAILEIDEWRRDLLGLSVPELVVVRRAAIGYCTQFLPAIPGKSGMELGCEVALPSYVTQVFERLALPPQIWNLPASTWSGGERQRLNIALAALRKPALVLLDEPFASLDPSLHSAIWEFLSDLADAGSSLIVGVHRSQGDLAPVRTLTLLSQPTATRSVA